MWKLTAANELPVQLYLQISTALKDVLGSNIDNCMGRMSIHPVVAFQALWKDR